MECKDFSNSMPRFCVFRIDLTRMECKAQFLLSASESFSSIDLTRMECKAIASPRSVNLPYRIDLTRMECKESGRGKFDLLR